ncbi:MULTISPECIES: acyl carrier protein [Legionella]|uniref:acyl carrier protein n=1 Tax=Legionella TaxID=445 RepID=UPI00095D949E|nr:MULTISPECIES: acyl carrier protein [Legionella]MBN9229023.1 acyl carrier protein [Legionella steelei]OJW06425.1 MAG: acyl carrier protein [Legionella sp. 39-23]
MSLERAAIYNRLNKTFRDVFDNENLSVSDATTANDIEEWDSLNHITLIVAVEAEFGFKFKMGEVVVLHNVGEMVDIIEKQGK